MLTFSVCTIIARTLHDNCTMIARTNHIHSDSYWVPLHDNCTNFARTLHDNCTPRKSCTMFARLRRCKIRELRGRFARCLHDAGKFQTLYVVKYNILYINIIIYTIITRAREKKRRRHDVVTTDIGCRFKRTPFLSVWKEKIVKMIIFSHKSLHG